MISFVIFMNVATTSVVPSYQHAPLPIVHKQESFDLGKFLENNWVMIIAFVIFLIRLQNSVEDIKKDNKNQIELIIKDIELVIKDFENYKTKIEKIKEKPFIAFIEVIYANYILNNQSTKNNFDTNFDNNKMSNIRQRKP